MAPGGEDDPDRGKTDIHTEIAKICCTAGKSSGTARQIAVSYLRLSLTLFSCGAPGASRDGWPTVSKASRPTSLGLQRALDGSLPILD